jgi:hypothetical protein
MSILETLYYQLASDPAQLSLIAGVVSSSYFFFGNLGGAYFGVVPAIQNLELPVDTKVALWKWSYDRAKVCNELRFVPIRQMYYVTDSYGWIHHGIRHFLLHGSFTHFLSFCPQSSLRHSCNVICGRPMDPHWYAAYQQRACRYARGADLAS